MSRPKKCLLILAGVFAFFIVIGVIGSLGDSSPAAPRPTPTPEPTSTPTPSLLTVQQVERVAYRLDVALADMKWAMTTLDEIRIICSNYEHAGWDYDRLVEDNRTVGQSERSEYAHGTLLAILWDESGLPSDERIASSERLLRTFCDRWS